MSLKSKKSYIDHPDFDCGQDGSGNTCLNEPIMNYDARNGDTVIKATVDNNTAIILGRDRNPFGSREEVVSNDPLQNSEVSGYSDYMGAGAIDMVVGRGAPYPVNTKIFGSSNLKPMYVSMVDPKLSAVKLKDGSHPGLLMDAARIYTSQMCDIDDYFKISQPDTFKVDRGPSSAIMIKADRCRIHARRDVKIIAGGDPGPKIDSNGYKIKEKGRIHLIAGNGTYENQQPIPLGRNLVDCLKDLSQSVQDSLEIMNNLAFAQSQLDTVVANSIRVTAVGSTTSDPISQVKNVIKQISDMKDKISIFGAKFVNLPSFEIDYLEPNGGKYILSKYNTTN